MLPQRIGIDVTDQWRPIAIKRRLD